ncbi:uncharacterized protein LOC132447425 [Gadus macrocephalus]|uniref:uncharacterized protein LOC132447425 n=1 Tax=Gadus macrocephalus TaxID=80720 RepID=UPI0028CB3EFB|nr:uncharacterized protein LOC132447425 [Gadus macrocephalus]
MGKIKRNRTKWVKSWIQQRQAQGAYPNLRRELALDEPADFQDFARMFPAQYQMLEESIRPIIQRKNTNYRDSISAGERLTVTLRFLATGESFKSLSYHFRMGESTIGQFVPETCEAIYSVLKEKYAKCPDTALGWQQVATGFLSRWNFPNCIGALDGRRVKGRSPPVSGSTNHNSKPPFPIDLMAMVDSDYRFLYVDVGSQGRISDGGVFAGCTFADALENRTTNMPAPAPLPGSDQLSPYCIVADEAFPLKKYLMKPYPQHGLSPTQRVFNDRLSRAQRVVKNAFGLLASRFRVLLTAFSFRYTAKVENIVLACCALHNFLTTESCEEYMADIVDGEGPDNGILPGKWREDPALQQASLPQATDAAPRAEQTRNDLCQYFMSDWGAVPSQRGNGSTQPEEPGSDVPLTGSPVAESPVCERTLTEVLDSRSSSGGTARSQRLPAKRTKKEVVLMQTIGKTLERTAAGAQEEGEHHAYLSVYCERIEHRMRRLPQHRLPEFEYEMDCLLYRFSQNQIQEPDRKDLTRLETDYKDEGPL